MNDIQRKLGVPDWEFRVVFGRTKIDYDPNKESRNRKEHGYSPESGAHHLERLIFTFGAPAPYMTSDAFVHDNEVRHMHMAIDDSGKVVLMVTTMRPDETVRLVSYRRASRHERECFRSMTRYQEPESQFEGGK